MRIIGIVSCSLIFFTNILDIRIFCIYFLDWVSDTRGTWKAANGKNIEQYRAAHHFIHHDNTANTSAWLHADDKMKAQLPLAEKNDRNVRREEEIDAVKPLRSDVKLGPIHAGQCRNWQGVRVPKHYTMIIWPHCRCSSDNNKLFYMYAAALPRELPHIRYDWMREALS